VSFEALRECFRHKELDGVIYVVLFGSRARGTMHPRSDYDLAYVADASLNRGWGVAAELWRRVTECCGLPETDLDLVDLEQASPVLLDDIAEAFIMIKGERSGFLELLESYRGNRRNGNGDSR
jgi:predicted nucleotidyltransferase